MSGFWKEGHPSDDPCGVVKGENHEHKVSACQPVSYAVSLPSDWKNSLIYHPFVLYSVIAAALWAADAIYGKVCSGRRRRASKKRESLFLILGTAIILINWIAKNLLLVCWGIDLLAVPL